VMPQLTPLQISRNPLIVFSINTLTRDFVFVFCHFTTCFLPLLFLFFDAFHVNMGLACRFGTHYGSIIYGGPRRGLLNGFKSKSD